MREAGVAGREREAVRVAHGRDDADLELEIQVADELLHHRDLLGVLAAEVGDVRPDDREELQAGRCDAPKMARAGLALEPECRALRLDPGREPVGIELGRRRGEEQVDAGRRRPLLVGCEIARVGGEVARVGELRRVEEQARDDEVAFARVRPRRGPLWPA